ncbi:MAG: type II toxin-antitoxin system VapC family toxin [Victivallales bacterium]
MEIKRILIDTSVIIDYLRRKNKEKSLFFTLVSDNQKLFISSVSVFELLAGADNQQKTGDVETILSFLEIIDFNCVIARKSSIYYQSLKKRNCQLEFRNLFIASTAIVYDLHVATLNVRHFSRIPEIKIISV